MRIIYRVNKPLFIALARAVKLMRPSRVEVDPAEVSVDGDEYYIEYVTSRLNKWFAGHDVANNIYFFGYEGTRNAFGKTVMFNYFGKRLVLMDYYKIKYVGRINKGIELMIWERLLPEDYESAEYYDDVVVELVRGITGEYNGLRYKHFIVKQVLEYETTLNKRLTHPLDTVEHTIDYKHTIIFRRGVPIRIIKYRQKYPPKPI